MWIKIANNTWLSNFEVTEAFKTNWEILDGFLILLIVLG